MNDFVYYSILVLSIITILIFIIGMIMLICAQNSKYKNSLNSEKGFEIIIKICKYITIIGIILFVIAVINFLSK